jgi:pentatricopeptide repeat protein
MVMSRLTTARLTDIWLGWLQVDCQPNLVVYHALMTALGRAGRWEEALALYEQRLRPEQADVSPTLATLSILFDCCLGPDGAEAALAAVGGVREADAANFSHAGATAAKALYRQAVADGMMEHACASGVMTGESSLRVDIRLHTRSAAIVALLCVLDDLQQAHAAGACPLPRLPHLVTHSDVPATCDSSTASASHHQSVDGAHAASQSQ